MFDSFHHGITAWEAELESGHFTQTFIINERAVICPLTLLPLLPQPFALLLLKLVLFLQPTFIHCFLLSQHGQEGDGWDPEEEKIESTKHISSL